MKPIHCVFMLVAVAAAFFYLGNVTAVIRIAYAETKDTACADLRREVERLNVENRALRAVCGKKWPGKVEP